jgi:hypothetical protein
MAIEQGRMIHLTYHQRERIPEPHDHGILNGSVQLLGYQVAGSSSRALPNWLLMKTDEITELDLLDQTSLRDPSLRFRRRESGIRKPGLWSYSRHYYLYKLAVSRVRASALADPKLPPTCVSGERDKSNWPEVSVDLSSQG